MYEKVRKFDKDTAVETLRAATLGDTGAQAKLTTAFLPLVEGLARRRVSMQSHQDDLVQAGAIALHNLVQRFTWNDDATPEGNLHQFQAKARRRVSGEMQNYIRDRVNIFKPRGVRERQLFYGATPETPREEEYANHIALGTVSVLPGDGYAPSPEDQVIEMEERIYREEVLEYLEQNPDMDIEELRKEIERRWPGFQP